MRLLHLVFNRSKWSGGVCFVCCRVIARGCVALLPGCGVALLPGCGVALLPAHPVDLRARGEGVVEYPGKVACPSGRRCSTRNAVWCHSHPGFKSQRYRHCRPAPLGPGGFVMPSWRAVLLCGCVAPRVFRAPEAPAAREARRPHFVRRRASKPARALRSLRRPPHQWGRGADVWLGASSRSPAGPRRRPPAPRQIPPAPSTPVGPGVLTGGWARRLVVRPGPTAAHQFRT